MASPARTNHKDDPFVDLGPEWARIKRLGGGAHGYVDGVDHALRVRCVRPAGADRRLESAMPVAAWRLIVGCRRERSGVKGRRHGTAGVSD